VLNLLDEAGAVLVVSAGNAGKITPAITDYPARFADPSDPIALSTHRAGPTSPIIGPLLNMIVVGSTDRDTYMSDFSQFSPWMTTL
jgi:hypothetical protein